MCNFGSVDKFLNKNCLVPYNVEFVTLPSSVLMKYFVRYKNLLLELQWVIVITILSLSKGSEKKN